MKKYEEEFRKTISRDRMSFIATLAVVELMDQGRLTKEEMIEFIQKNAQGQKKPERADDLIEFLNQNDPKAFLPQFGWRIFDLKQFYEDRKKFRKEIHEQRVKANEEKIAKERAEREALKAKKKQQNQPKTVEPAPAPKKKIIVVKRPKVSNQNL